MLRQIIENGNNCSKKVVTERGFYIIKSTTLEEFEKERSEINAKLSEDENFRASILIEMFKLEVSLLGIDLQKIDRLVKLYTSEIKPDIKTEADRKNYEMLSSSEFPNNRSIQEYWEYHDIWLNLNFNREAIYRYARWYLNDISQNVTDKVLLHELLIGYENKISYIPGLDSDV